MRPDVRFVSFASFAWHVLGCGNAGESPVDADLSFTTDGGGLCSAGDVESTCCDILSPVPAQVRTVVDLSDVGAITDGTCGAYLPGRRAVMLPSDPAAYPLAVILPAIDGADPACTATCEFEPYTAFGIAVATDGLIGGDTGRTLAVLVPPPWRFVSGGCGEACAWPCLGGYGATASRWSS